MPTVTENMNDPESAASDRMEIERIAVSLIDDEPAFLSSLDFGPFVVQGEGDGRKIIIGDQSEIPLLTIAERPYLDHRMALLARSGDLLVVSRPVQSFFRYLSETLGSKNVSVMGTGHHPLESVTRLCRTKADLRRSLLGFVKGGEGTTLQSYLTTGNTWRLAQWLGEASRKKVHVAGPSPRLARRVNDKLWFADLARCVLGRDAVPPTLRAFGPAAAAGHVRRIARQGEQVVVKVPDSAGSTGNIRLDSGEIAAAPLALVQRFLRRRLHAIGWTGRYPLLVGVWDKDVTCSPSVQLWIPSLDDGPPRLDGIFEQRVQGLGAAFVGAERTTLSEGLQSRLTAEALRIACVLQRIGYFGRCSFDAVMVKSGDGGLQPHWIECNGRWGGVSIPLTAAIRLNQGEVPKGLVLLQATLGTRNLSMTDLYDCLDPLLYRKGLSRDGVVIVAPPSAEPEPQITLMAMADSQGRAGRLMEIAVTRLRF